MELTLIKMIALAACCLALVSADSQQYNTFHYANHPYIKYMGHHPGYAQPQVHHPEPAPVHVPAPAPEMPEMGHDDMMMGHMMEPMEKEAMMMPMMEKESMMPMMNEPMMEAKEAMMMEKESMMMEPMPQTHHTAITPYHHPQPAAPTYHQPQPAPYVHQPHQPYHHPHQSYHHEPAYVAPAHHAPHHMQPYHHPNMYHHAPAHAVHHPAPVHHAHHVAPAYHHQPAAPVHHAVAPVHHAITPVHHTVHHAVAPHQPAAHPVHHASHHGPHMAYHHQTPQYHHYQAPHYQPHHQPNVYHHHAAHPAAMSEMKDEEMMMDDHQMAPMKPAAEPAAATAAVAHSDKTPKYLGRFSKATHDVSGDIFLLDERTIYIQGFSFDGQAPDVHFWSDGVAIPYYTRTNPHVAMVVGKYHKEDVVLMLPPEKPTIKELGHFQVWCRQYGINFGEFSMKNAHL